MMRLVFSVLLLSCLGWAQAAGTAPTAPTRPGDVFKLAHCKIPPSPCWMMNVNGELVQFYWPKPEPSDVPAINDKRKVCAEYSNVTWDGHPSCLSYKDEDYFTCKKGGHRILLRDEDGDWHCVKFSKGDQ